MRRVQIYDCSIFLVGLQRAVSVSCVTAFKVKVVAKKQTGSE